MMGENFWLPGCDIQKGTMCLGYGRRQAGEEQLQKGLRAAAWWQNLECHAEERALPRKWVSVNRGEMGNTPGRPTPPPPFTP